MLQTKPNLDAGTQLRRAAAEGDIDKVRNLLDKNFINHKSTNGNTALHWSIENQHYGVTKLLLTCPGIQLDVANHRGLTPLHLTAKQGDKKTVYRLLKAGAGHKNSTDKEGYSALDYAFSESCSFIVSKLKEKLPHLPFKDEDALANRAFTAFKIKNFNLVRNAKIFDSDYFFNEDVARYFLPGNRFKLAEIQTAIKKGQLNLHKLFCSGNLLQSAAVSRVDTMEKFQWLLEQGVNPNLQASHEINPSSYKNTALHTLIANEDEKDAVKFIDLLITHAKPKFNFNLVDSEGKTCLCLAVKVGLFEVAKKLIGLKVDINRPDEDGNSPLHYAFLLGNTSIVDELLANQANKNAKNTQHQSPYELLISTDIEDVRDCLEIIWINPDRKIKKSKKTYIQQCMENRENLAYKFRSLRTDSAQRSSQTMVTHCLGSAEEISIAQKRKSIVFLLAAATGDLAKIQETCDADILNIGNSKGNTALHLACEHGHEEIVKFLLQQPEIDLHKENHESIKAAERVSNLSLVSLFEDKLLTIIPKAEHRNDTLSRLNQRKEILSHETMSALRKN
ncbi:ankyrin repeat domain-containing protein [Rickettsiella endosymbiont of Aleochara curtula]|uniref:ankyrin repeat domain-containing protein n=1 Tax=Rickettsiella endosymbiont of Aleochara curtula TaxID=3077936 RepID=UPI00313E5B63